MQDSALTGDGRLKLPLNISLPLADQIADHFRALIVNGELHFGDELPPAKSFNDVSHVTVLNAYRKLADEGYIHLQRAKKTKVMVNIENQRYVILCSYKGHTLYEDTLLSECQQSAIYKDRSPESFYFGKEKITTMSKAESAIPAYLKRMIIEGHVRGVIFHKPDHIPGVLEWIRKRRIPSVSLSPFQALPHMCPDHIKSYLDGIRFLAGKGCRNICILAWHWNKIPPEIRTLQNDLPGLDWLDIREFDKNDPINCGRKFVSKCFGKIKNPPDAMIVMDDIAGLGALLELKEKGIRIPQDTRLLVSSYSNQILPAYNGCDKAVISVDRYVSATMQLLEDIISGKKSTAAVRTFPYMLVPAEE